MMGAAAERLADTVYLTDDNPRHENGARIIADILGGMNKPSRAIVERDRGNAIAQAMGEADPGDIILVAGKGHEDSQQMGDRRVPHSDREWVRRGSRPCGH